VRFLFGLGLLAMLAPGCAMYRVMSAGPAGKAVVMDMKTQFLYTCSVTDEGPVCTQLKVEDNGGEG
jgi:hypothetical protein